MITLEQADNDIIQSIGIAGEGDFVGIAIKLNADGVAIHAGLLIKHSNNHLILHYIPDDVQVTSIPGPWYYHKTLSLIDPLFVLAFRSYCDWVVENANPEYGYIYTGCLYNENGQYFSETAVPEIMTCVGFCISVIKGFIDAEEYFQYTDWGISSVDDDEYLEFFVNKFSGIYSPEEMKNLENNIRRILPVELLASAFIDDELPIRKTAVDAIVEIVKQVLVNKVQGIAIPGD